MPDPASDRFRFGAMQTLMARVGLTSDNPRHGRGRFLTERTGRSGAGGQLRRVAVRIAERLRHPQRRVISDPGPTVPEPERAVWPG